MNIKRVLLAVNAIICLMLLVLGLLLVIYPSESADTNYFMLTIGIVVSFLSLIGWSHLYSQKSPMAKKVRNISSAVFITFVVITISVAIFALQSINNWG